MAVFEPVTLTWQGEEFTVPADRVMGLICEVEEVVTLGELMGKKTTPVGKVSRAYAAALRYAGARVRDDEVYAGMFSSGGENINQAVNGLLSMMIPPSHLAGSGGGGQSGN